MRRLGKCVALTRWYALAHARGSFGEHSGVKPERLSTFAVWRPCRAALSLGAGRTKKGRRGETQLEDLEGV